MEMGLGTDYILLGIKSVFSNACEVINKWLLPIPLLLYAPSNIHYLGIIPKIQTVILSLSLARFWLEILLISKTTSTSSYYKIWLSSLRLIIFSLALNPIFIIFLIYI